MPSPLYRLLIIVIIVFITTIPSLTQGRAVEFRLPDATLSEETPVEKFNRSDANADGKLSFDEFLQMELPYVLMKKTEFSEFDLNGDGFITKREYKGKLHKHSEKYDVSRAHYFGQIYGDYDEDFDMKLSEDEIKRMINNRFQLKAGSNFNEIFRSFDTNNDGGLDIDEYIKFDDNMPLDEFQPDETNTDAGDGPPKSRVHCDADDGTHDSHHHVAAAAAKTNTTTTTNTTITAIATTATITSKTATTTTNSETTSKPTTITTTAHNQSKKISSSSSSSRQRQNVTQQHHQ